MRKVLLVVLVLFFALIEVKGQVRTRKLENVKVTNTKAVFLGKTKRVDELIKLPPTSLEKKSRNKNLSKQYPNFLDGNRNNAVKPDLEHQGPDPIRQRVLDKSSQRTSEIIVNIDGASGPGFPDDPSGAIGKDHYVQAVNATTIRVFNKDGTNAGTFSGNSLWAPLGETSAGDPIVVYDSELDQWIITEFTAQGINTLLIAVSETSDPFGSYFVYSFAAPTFPDYPKYGIWGDFLVVTTNENGPGTLHQYFIEREALMRGDDQDDINIQRIEILGPPNGSLDVNFLVTSPINWLGGPAPKDGSSPIVVRLNDSSWGEVENDALEIYTFEIDLVNPGKTQIINTTLETAPYDPFPCGVEDNFFECITQPGANVGLAGFAQLVMNVPQYRDFGTHESIVLTFITDVTNGENVAGIRWMELRRVEDSDWSIYQEGTFAPDDGLQRWMPTIAIDAEGNIGLSYSITGTARDGSQVFPGLRYTGRLDGDPLGIMTVAEEEVVAGLSPVFQTVENGTRLAGRIGDYAHMTVDPVDGRTFWNTSEYAGVPPNGASTRVFSFQLERFNNDLIVDAILNPESAGLGSEESVTANIINRGSLPAENFSMQLMLDGVEVSTFNNTEPLASEGSLEVTFETLVDLSEIRDYDLTVNITYADDENLSNNSLTATVVNLATSDVALEVTFQNVAYCTNSAEGILSVTNNGLDELTSAVINVTVNGNDLDPINWSGSLENGESDFISFTANNLLQGTNSISSVASMPNAREDGDLSNNSSDVSITNDPSLEQVEINLFTDRFPQEVSWRITDENNEVVVRNSPIVARSTEVSELICLDPTQCYTFTIVDAQRDGICCGFGEGSYSLIDDEGNSIFEGNGEFGVSESTDFCVGDCNLMAEIDVSNVVGDQPGSILITATGGNDIEYSIDGGENFQASGLFEGLAIGDYDVVVSSDNGECVVRETVSINTVVSTQASLEENVTLFPNPTEGIFQLSVKDNENLDGFLNVKVIDINGKIIQDLRFSKYDEFFEGTISLVAFPDGIYFVKLANMKNADLLRVIKQ